MNANDGRTIVIGLDGADHVSIERWIEQGYLPCLKELLASSHRMNTTPKALPGSEWVNFATGVGPGQHRYVHSTQLEVGSYQHWKFQASDVACDPFYKTLSDAGKRCIILDMPVDRPIPDFNGAQVVDWGTEFQLAEFGTNPPELKRELLQKFGTHVFTDYGHTKADNHSLRALRAKIEVGIEKKTALVTDLLTRNDWDFFFVSFCEAHKAGHFFLKYEDESHPDHETVEPYLQHSLRATYELIDQSMQKILSMLSPQDNVIILSDRGMEPDYRGEHLMGHVLQRLGLATYKKPPSTRPHKRAADTRFGILKGRLRSTLRRAIPSPLLPLARNALGGQPLDWSATRAFMLPNVGNSYIRINLKGREPQGVVESGAEYDELLVYIERELYALTNPDTGEPAVAEVSFPGRLFPGPYSGELPDISILWHSDRPIRSLQSPSMGTIVGEPPGRRAGNHRAEGIALARGAAFRADPSTRVGDLRQWAPTILQIYGLPVPSHYDMSALTEILATQPRSTHSSESTGDVKQQVVG